MSNCKWLDSSNDSPGRSKAPLTGGDENINYTSDESTTDESKSSCVRSDSDTNENQSPDDQVTDGDDDSSEVKVTRIEGSSDSWRFDADAANDNENSGRRSWTTSPAFLNLLDHLKYLAERITNDVVISAPTMAIQIPKLPSRYVPNTFHIFSRFPSEIRLKIWALSRTESQILHVNYHHDDVVSYYSREWPRSFHKVCRWVFENKKNPFTCLAVCQESRLEGLKSRFFQDYERIHLHQDITQRAWFNFKTDVYFLNTSATERVNEGQDNYGNQKKHYHERKNIPFDRYINDARNYATGPLEAPFCRSVFNKLRFLAMSSRLWDSWPFADIYGSDVTCPCCRGYGEDISQENFHSSVLKDLKCIENITLVRLIHGKEYKFTNIDRESQAKFRSYLEHLWGDFVSANRSCRGSPEKLARVAIKGVDMEMR